MPTDQELLQRYAQGHNNDAFAELVHLHIDLVFAAALRRTGGRHALAEEITQQVFTDLARKASRLIGHPTLAGWLHRSTRYAAIDAIRDEARRRKLAESVHTMPDTASPQDTNVNWEQLRPILDDALDRLKERDRELMLLRFFQGLTFREIGIQLGLSENAARMRTERALDSLRVLLVRRGVTSTSAALSILLANHPVIAAPAGLAAHLTSLAVAIAPAGGIGSAVSFLVMNKLTAPAVGAALAAGLTSIVWISVTPGITAGELAALREENSRLAAATAAGAPIDSLAAVANEYTTQALAIAHAVAKRQPGPASPHSPTTTESSTPNGHSNRGQSTAHDAMLSFAWANDAGDIDALSRLICFDNQGREKALAVYNAMPSAIRAEYATPEELYAFFLIADALLHPPPKAAFVERCEVVDAGPGLVSLRRPGQAPDRYHQYQQTSDGWKFLIPEPAVDHMPQVLNSETLSQLSGS